MTEPKQSPWGIFPIESERLLLRPPIVTDAEAMCESKRETWAQLQKWMPFAKGEGPDLEADRAMIEEQSGQFESGKDCMLIGLEKASGKPVVFTGLHRPDWDNRVFEIGYWVRESAQGKGYAQEVTRTLTQYAFNTLGANKVAMSVAEGNEASQAVIEKCGFRFTHANIDEKDGHRTRWYAFTPA